MSHIVFVNSDTPTTNFPPNLAGWANHKLVTLAEQHETNDDNWNLRWIVVEVFYLFFKTKRICVFVTLKVQYSLVPV